MSTSSAHAGKAGSKSKAKSAAPKTAPAKAAASGPSPAVMATYARQNVVFERGEGAWLDRQRTATATSTSAAASPSMRWAMPIPSWSRR